MGVLYYLECEQCKEFIDLHKARRFFDVCYCHRPATADDAYDEKHKITLLDGGYWDGRGTWFLFRHIGHPIVVRSDHDEGWYDDMAYLKEVYPHNDDEKIRDASPSSSANTEEK